MDRPSGAHSARAAQGCTRPSAPFKAIGSRSALLLTAAALLCGPPAGAQEAYDPLPATMAPLASQSLLLDAAVAGERWVVVGERGHVLVSSDRGASWQQSEVPTRAMLTGVFFIDEAQGWAVGHDSAILRTGDGGTTWELVNWAPEEEAPLFDVWFSDADNGVAIGAYGTYMVSADGGETWDFEAIGDLDWHLHKIRPAGGDRMYMAAEAGTVYRSDDGGVTWEELPSPYEGSFFGVLPLEGDTVLLFGLRGHLFRSEDAGETWRQLDTGTVAMLTDGERLEDGTIVIVGLGGTVLTSDDEGRSFTLHQQPNRRGISAVVAGGDGSLLLVGEFGARVATLDELSSPAE